MKKLLFVLAILLPVMANAMKIEKDEIDEFTGQRTVITSWEGMCKNYIHIRFRLQNGIQILDFKFIPDDAIVIGEGAKLMFKSTTDNIAEFKSIGMYHGGKGDGAVGLSGSAMWGIYAKYSGDLEWFKDNCSKLIRIYASDVYYDRKISESEGKKLMKLYELFSQTLNNEQGKSIFGSFNLTFVKKKVSAHEWDIVKEEFKPDVTKEELNAIIDEWKSQSNDKTLYDVKVKKEK